MVLVRLRIQRPMLTPSIHFSFQVAVEEDTLDV